LTLYFFNSQENRIFLFSDSSERKIAEYGGWFLYRTFPAYPSITDGSKEIGKGILLDNKAIHCELIGNI
jgi:hypothetical protein